MGEKRNANKVLVGKPETKKPLGRPRNRWGNNKMDLEGTEWEGVDSVLLAQDKDQRPSLVNTAVHLRVKINAGNVSIS
jgi:hypothetical protein